MSELNEQLMLLVCKCHFILSNVNCTCIVCFFQCGCFRRKKPVEKVDGEGNNEDFEAFDKDPFNQPKLTAMKQIDEKA